MILNISDHAITYPHSICTRIQWSYGGLEARRYPYNVIFFAALGLWALSDVICLHQQEPYSVSSNCSGGIGTLDQDIYISGLY